MSKIKRHSGPQTRPQIVTFLGGFLVVLLVLGGIGVSVVSSLVPGSETACTVTDKDRTTNRDGKSDMRIYTENCGTLRVKDNIFVGQFDSADIYSKVKVGKTYDFETRGFRVPFLSMFPGIVKVTEAR